MLARLFPNPRFHGWRVLAACLGLAALSGPGQSYLLSLYIDHLVEDLGVSRLEVSSVYGGATVVAALALPWVGGLADRLRARTFARGVLVLLAAAAAGLAFSHALWAVALAFFALRLLGQGSISLGITTTVVRWFFRYRGRALALTSAGYAVGEAIYPTVAVALIAGVGWRGSLLVVAAAYVLLFAPLLGRILRERRADEPIDGGPVPDDGRSARLQTSIDWDPRDALRAPVFWLLLAASCVSPFLLTGMIFHMPAIFRSVGWAAEAAPRAFAAYAAAGLALTYATGLVMERIHARFGLFVGLVVLGASALLPFLPLSPSVGPWVFGAALGGSAGIAHGANGILWPAYFGVRSLGALKGVVNAARNGSTALAPPLAAWMAGPEESFVSFALLCAAVAAAFALAALAAPAQARHPDPAGERAGALGTRR